MTEIKIFRTNTVDAAHKLPVPTAKNEEKQLTDKQVTSYDNPNANSAIRNSFGAFPNKNFTPATTKDEFIAQIKAFSPADSANIEYAVKNVDRMKEADIPLISELFHKFDSLSDDLKKEIKLWHYTHIPYGNSYREKIKSFSPEVINKLDNEIQQKFADKIVNFADCIIIQDAEGINELYKTLNEQDRDVLFNESFNIYRGNNETHREYIAKAKLFNNLNDDAKKEVDITKFIVNNYTLKQTALILEHLNYLANEGKPLKRYNTDDLLKENYSYAIELKDISPKAATSDFKPFLTKNELYVELGSMKSDDGMFMFTNDTINSILNNENNIPELSKILDAIKKSGLQLNRYNYEKLLLSEGITFAALEKQLDFIKKVNEDENLTDLKELINQSPFDILASSEDEIQKIEENAGLIQQLKKVFPKDFNGMHTDTIISVLKTANVTPESFQKITELNLYPDETDLYPFITLLKDESLNNLNQKNTDFIRDMKNEPGLAFMFDGNGYGNISNYDINYILTKEIPPEYQLKNKSDIIDFICEIRTGDAAKIFERCGTCIDLLLKNSDDNAEDGRKIAEFLQRHDMIDCNACKYFTERPFTETVDLINKFEGNGYINDYSFIYNKETPFEDFENYFELINYAQTFDSLKNDIKLNSDDILFVMQSKRKMGWKPVSKEKVEAEIKNLDEISKNISSELWDNIKKPLLQNVLENSPLSKYNLRRENLEYFSQFASDKRTSELFHTRYIEYIDLLRNNLDIEALKANQDKMYNFAGKYCDKEFANKYGIYTDKNELITFTGDFDKFEEMINKLINENPQTVNYVSVDEYSNVTVYDDTNDIERIYDKNFNLLSEKAVETEEDEYGNEIYKIHFSDKKLNVENDIISTKDEITNVSIPLEIKSEYYDDNNNLIKTKKYEKTDVDGVVIEKEEYPTGEVRILSDYNRTVNGITITKNLESPEAIKTTVNFTQDNRGNEEYFYAITDKDGKNLCEMKRTVEIIDENTKITKVNDKSYRVTAGNGKISVYDFQTGKTTDINLAKMNPKGAVSLNDTLKTLSGDELINLQKYVNNLELSKRTGSAMDPVGKIMYTGPHKFVLEHELGHAKDYISASADDIANFENQDELETKIANDPKLQSIFEEEKANLKKSIPSCLQEELDYFINDTTHYGGKLGGLKEVIAETNGIQNTPQYHSLLQTRTQLLQEYFPRTIAYLINEYYA